MAEDKKYVLYQVKLTTETYGINSNKTSQNYYFITNDKEMAAGDTFAIGKKWSNGKTVQELIRSFEVSRPIALTNKINYIQQDITKKIFSLSESETVAILKSGVVKILDSGIKLIYDTMSPEEKIALSRQAHENLLLDFESEWQRHTIMKGILQSRKSYNRFDDVVVMVLDNPWQYPQEYPWQIYNKLRASTKATADILDLPVEVLVKAAYECKNKNILINGAKNLNRVLVALERKKVEEKKTADSITMQTRA